MHAPIQRVEFMNAPKLSPLKHDWPKFTKSVNVYNSTSHVCLKKTHHVPVFFHSFFLLSGRGYKRRILQQSAWADK